MSSILYNFDLLTVGIAVASTFILGFSVYFSDKKSNVNRSFLMFSVITALWGILNYISYQFESRIITLWLLRFVLFFATFQSFYIYKFVFFFDDPNRNKSNWYLYFLLPLVFIISLLTLTPAVFSNVFRFNQETLVATPVVNPGILGFASLSIGLVLSSMYMLFSKLRNSKKDKSAYKIIAVGISLMFIFIIIFNFVLPVVYGKVNFIPYGALFALPFAATSAYAILKKKLFDVKVAGASILVFALSIITFSEVIVANKFSVILYRSAVFVFVIVFGIMLIRSVLREIKQREKLEVLTHALETANKKLMIADRMKSQFLSFASHQVKSPMTVVKGYATLIQDGSYGEVPEKVKETTEKIKESADRLIALVNNLLDLRKLEEGKIEYKFEPTDLTTLTREVVDELETLAKNKGITLTTKLPRQSIHISSDTEKIRQVIQNLIDNSIKYTEHGSVSIELVEANGMARAVVSDTGIGIASDLLPNLFEQFNRGSGEARKIQGTGLGLYIAKQFVLAHKGKIWAESDGTGKGSRFIFEIPLKS